MNYREALAYIHGTLKFGSKLGLENIKQLLKLMDNPQKKLKFIHVAGTNGKGSTTAMIANILKEQGYRVGMYTSPYIQDFTERVQINGTNIEKNRLAEITEKIRHLIGDMVRQGQQHPTEFEIVTAIAFQYYYEENCDFVVLEVGLGGRFDATNVIDPPLISVITSISMDHMEYLGDTIEKIAFEKCGIIKPDSVVVGYPVQHPDAQNVIQNTCGIRHVPLEKGDFSGVHLLSDSLNGVIFDYRHYKSLHVPLLGSHQVLNAITAITAIEALKEYYHVQITNESIKNGLETVKWPGRLEVLGENPLFLADGAHNIGGIQVLKDFLLRYAGHKKITMLAGMLKDKEYEKCMEIIGPLANRFIATSPLNPRALAAEEMGKLAEKYCTKRMHTVTVEADINKAVQLALQQTEDDQVIMCFGSLYLIGDVIKFYKNMETKKELSF